MPAGIRHWDWPADPQGRSCAAGELRLAPRDLLKLGLLYLDHGRWDGNQVVDEGYVHMATAPLNGGCFPERTAYGLLWWVAADRTPRLYFAGGYGGQYVVVVPDLELVVVTTADAYAWPHPNGALLRALVMWTIVPALRRSTPAGGTGERGARWRAPAG